MKSILVPIEDHGVIEPVLETAFLIGQRFGSYIEGLAITPDYPVVLPVDIAIGVPSPITPENRQEMAKACHERFHAFMARKGVAASTASLPGLSFGWRQDGLSEDAFMGAYGRVFDVTALGRPDGTNGHSRLSTVEAALFETGRPVLIRSPDRAQDARRHDRDRLEPEHRDGAGGPGGDAAPDKGQPGRRAGA